METALDHTTEETAAWKKRRDEIALKEFLRQHPTGKPPLLQNPVLKKKNL